ncbi:PHD finger protein 12 isoform X1 [Biomphalaria glabrata]|uniref:PHD finger protein 12 n=2 Tax=Biomphalaria glabrata TaxID=6526 RepID=A0A9W2YHW0_BIOGL|nr:PHD finger protein 12 isoform X1 [Biomphalaria glabrata]XP_055862284.1 PHD finger protein 12 isoform X1 [Biomphalaria glabrata]XP_055862285.1 PHD finger protein 12 isoform X1 [Biomphalaria glabrata]KAI8782938.1 PHD finger protein 12 isoform X1 [Biomphalaria glabrata]
MSNAELWDLDTSGGIMEQIQMLVAPPVSADALRRSRRRRERDVYRRPGRAVNHDCCDSCKEGGDLICCDRCPAAFHLLCHDPPLSEEDLPTGEWLCHKCKITPLESKEDDTESTSSKSSNRSNRTKRPAAHMEADGELDHPLKTLVKAARLMNPMQFDVGKEISCNKPLPGSSKRVYGKVTKNVPKKLAHELDNGLVPLPAKVCFSCNKSCRVAPLIQCDYCPLLFHLDCLNPPLTSLPTGRWMCPNHVENFLDSHLLKSQSLTERLRLWDRYTGLVDSHAVKVDFLNKIHRKHPMFRFRRKLPSRLSISVPPAVKYFYQNPPTLLPDPARNVSCTSNVNNSRGTSLATLDEQEDWLSSVVSMQASIAKYLAQKQIKRSSENNRISEMTITVGTSKPTASVAPVVQKETDQVEAEHKTEAILSNNSNIDCDRDKQLNSTVPPCTEHISVFNNLTCAATDVKNNSLQILTLDIPSRGIVSLLPNNLVGGSNMSSPQELSPNQLAASCTERAVPEDAVSVLRGRSNSVDSSSLCRPLWSGGDNNLNVNGDINSNTNCGSKLLVNSAIQNNSKCISGRSQPAKVILPSVKGPHFNSNGSQSQRVIVQSSNKTQVSVASSGSTPKVITVSATTSVCNSSSSIPSKNSHVSSLIGSGPNIAHLNSILQQCIEGNPDDVEFSKIDEQLTQILAWQRLQQLLPTKSTSTNATTTTNLSGTQSTTNKKGLLNVYLSQQTASEVRSRAVLCPLSGQGQAIPMPYRSLSLGTGADMDVCLSHYGYCNFISSHHATLFYDEMSRHFELLNYSEHGTTVDNVLYSCDFSDKPATTPQPSPVISAVRDIIHGSSKSNRMTDLGNKDKQRMSSRANGTVKSCGCKASSSSLIGGSGAGWEGTALLHHGSYIKVGCLQFVFSIVDHAPDQLSYQKQETSPLSQPGTAAVTTTTRFSSMPLISSSPHLHNQPAMSLLKSHLKTAALP